MAAVAAPVPQPAIGLLWRLCNYGILASTLFTFRDHACDNERLSISCPEGTTIDVASARYGRTAPSAEMCPFTLRGSTWAELSSISGQRPPPENTNCLADNSLKVVQEQCQDSQRCRFLVSAEIFGGDPCPGTSKYLEIAYKCRPNEFRSRTVCEDDQLSLQCDSRKLRIAIYSAMFGRTQGSAATSCPTKPAYDAECQAECALEAVMQNCHGKRRCDIHASTAVFGDPCSPGTSKYLSVVYTCVSRRVLREIDNNEIFTNAFCGDQLLPTQLPPWDSGWGDTDGWGDGEDTGGGGGGVKGGEGGGWGDREDSAAVYPPSTLLITTPPHVTPKKDLSYTVRLPYETEGGGSTGGGRGNTGEDPHIGAVEEEGRNRDVITGLLHTYRYLADNEERLVLYTVVSVLIGIILLLLVIILRLALTRRSHEKRARLEISDPLPGGATAQESSPAAKASDAQRPEDVSLLGSEDAQHSTDGAGIEMLSFTHHSHMTPSIGSGGIAYTRNHYNTTPKTFGTPNNNNNHNHLRYASLSRTGGPPPTSQPHVTDTRTSSAHAATLPHHPAALSVSPAAPNTQRYSPAHSPSLPPPTELHTPPISGPPGFQRDDGSYRIMVAPPQTPPLLVQNRTASLPRRYYSPGSRTYDNFYR